MLDSPSLLKATCSGVCAGGDWLLPSPRSWPSRVPPSTVPALDFSGEAHTVYSVWHPTVSTQCCVQKMRPRHGTKQCPPHPQVGLLGVRPLWPFLGVLWVAAADYGPTFPSFLLNYDVCVMKATALYCKIFVGCYFHVMSLIPLAISFKKLSKLRYNSHIIKFAPFQCMICPGW